jgi:hypothetical protein
MANLTSIPNIFDHLIKPIFIHHLHHLNNRSPLNREPCFLTQFQNVLLSFFEPKRRRYFIINVQLHDLENDCALVIDNVAKPVYQVATPVDHAVTFVKQLALLASHDYVVAKVVDVKVSHDVL